MQVVGREPAWLSASQVILGPDPALAVYGEAVVWLHKVELFRQEEAARMYRQEPSREDRALHQRLLERLIADGDHLTRLIGQHGLIANVQGLSAEDVQATLRSLGADYRGWHQPLSPEKRDSILREVFDGTPPTH